MESAVEPSLDADLPERVHKELSRQLLDATSDVVWAIHPQKDSLGELAQRMRDFAGDLFSGDEIRVSMGIPEQDVRLEPELRRHGIRDF